ncbi:hypothetical protein TYRP_006155 [Tyrophagus putrescentiae]|nr:hypothetical protein TYRP_006155 [Tyrophagus putrescentiae]
MTTNLADRPTLIRSCGVSRYSSSCSWWALSPISTSDGEMAMPRPVAIFSGSPPVLSMMYELKGGGRCPPEERLQALLTSEDVQRGDDQQRVPLAEVLFRHFRGDASSGITSTSSSCSEHTPRHQK